MDPVIANKSKENVLTLWVICLRMGGFSYAQGGPVAFLPSEFFTSPDVHTKCFSSDLRIRMYLFPWHPRGNKGLSPLCEPRMSLPCCSLGFMNIIDIHGVADNLYCVSKALMGAEQGDFFHRQLPSLGCSCQINTTFSVRAMGTFSPSEA